LARLTLFKDAKLDLEAKEAMTRRNGDINWFKPKKPRGAAVGREAEQDWST
jgi:hypothetical protein